MSCYWHLHCETCKETLDLEGLNRQPYVVRDIIKIAPALVAAGKIRPRTLDLAVVARCGTVAVDLNWLVHHEGHKLVPISEYGQIDGECGAIFPCPHCESRIACRLPPWHDGPHSRELPP